MEWMGDFFNGFFNDIYQLAVQSGERQGIVQVTHPGPYPLALCQQRTHQVIAQMAIGPGYQTQLAHRDFPLRC